MNARKPDRTFDTSRTWHVANITDIEHAMSERGYRLYCDSDYYIVERNKDDSKVYAVLEGTTYFSDCLIDCTLKEAGEFFDDMAKELDEEDA